MTFYDLLPGLFRNRLDKDELILKSGREDITLMYDSVKNLPLCFITLVEMRLDIVS